MSLVTDKTRAAEVVRCLDAAFAGRSGILAETDDLVESQVPPEVNPGSLEHALFLFYTVPNDRGMKSSRLYAKAKSLYGGSPQLFNPFAIVSAFLGGEDPRLFEATGRALGTRYPAETARAWYINSAALISKYSGDPRQLFRCSSDARVLLREIMSFRGFGPKTGGMLLRALVGLGFAEPSNLEEVLVPVDVHDCRISWFTGVIRSSEDPHRGHFDHHLHVRPVQRLLRDTCRELGVSWLNVDRALWLIGSRGCSRGRCCECPLRAMCSAPRHSDGNWGLPLDSAGMMGTPPSGRLSA